MLVLDPNLVARNGHHLLYDVEICKEFQRRGFEVQIVANRMYKETSFDGIPIVPFFNSTSYYSTGDENLFGPFDSAFTGSEIHFRDLCRLSSDILRRTDLILVPTLSHVDISAYSRWLQSLSDFKNPAAALFLMLPSGIAIKQDGGFVVEDIFIASRYREALTVGKLMDRAAIFATGEQHSAEFSLLSGRIVPSHPLITSVDGFKARDLNDVIQNVLVYAGDAKIEKGIQCVPEIVRRIRGSGLDVNVIGHVNAESAWGDALHHVSEIRVLVESGLAEFEFGFLSTENYRGLLDKADVILLPYDSDVYKNKSSGVLWECVAMGRIPILPASSWLHREAAAWSLPCSTFEGGASEIVTALVNLTKRWSDFVPIARDASLRFRSVNGAKHLADSVINLSMRRIATDLSVAPRRAAILDLRSLVGEGWYEPENFNGTDVRWSKRNFVVTASGQQRGNWKLSVAGAMAFSEQQVRGVSATWGGTSKTVSVEWVSTRKWKLHVEGFLGRREEVFVEFQLPCTFRPEQETRDLGVLISELELVPIDSLTVEEDLYAPLGEFDSRAAALPLILSDHLALSIPSEGRSDVHVRLKGPHSPGSTVLYRLRAFANGVEMALHHDVSERAFISTATVKLEPVFRSSDTIYLELFLDRSIDTTGENLYLQIDTAELRLPS